MYKWNRGYGYGISEAESTFNLEVISLDNDVKVPDCLHHMHTFPDASLEYDFGAGGTLHDRGLLF